MTDKYKEQSPDWVKVGLSLFVRYRSTLLHQPECQSVLLSTAFQNPLHRRSFGGICGAICLCVTYVLTQTGGASLHSVDTIVQ